MQDTSALLTFALATAATCVAQNGLVIHGAEKQEWQADAQRIYQSACLAVQREFRIIEPVRPAIPLIVGAQENEAHADSKEIRLINGILTYLPKALWSSLSMKCCPRANEWQWRSVPSFGRLLPPTRISFGKHQ